MKESRYAKEVVFEGKKYSVSAEYNSDGNIHYFNLIDEEGEFFFEMDYEAYNLSEEDICKIVSDDIAQKREESLQIQNKESIKAIQEQINDAFYAEILASRYPHYNSLGDEFQNEAIDLLKRNSDESIEFQDILLDELVDEFEEE